MLRIATVASVLLSSPMAAFPAEPKRIAKDCDPSGLIEWRCLPGTTAQAVSTRYPAGTYDPASCTESKANLFYKDVDPSKAEGSIYWPMCEKDTDGKLVTVMECKCPPDREFKRSPPDKHGNIKAREKESPKAAPKTTKPK